MYPYNIFYLSNDDLFITRYHFLNIKSLNKLQYLANQLKMVNYNDHETRNLSRGFGF